MSRELISHPDFAKYDTSTLLTVGGGGAQLQPDLVGKIDQTVKSARPNTGYGMTETSPYLTLSLLSPAQRALPADEQLALRARVAAGRDRLPVEHGSAGFVLTPRDEGPAVGHPRERLREGKRRH